MTYISRPLSPGSEAQSRPSGTRGSGRGKLLAGLVIAGAAASVALLQARPNATPPAAPPPPTVTVGAPLHETVATTTEFLGQFSAVDRVELRAQVGGTLTSIGFKDGQIVHKGDLLFTIDARPYEVKLAEAAAQLQSAQARTVLTGVELWRAAQLRRSDYGSAETVDQRAADQRAAEAATNSAKAAMDDARLDLEFSRVVSPFTGRIGAHQVSAGNLVSGSRAGSSPTTLLATLVSLDPIHLDFDISEADYLAFQRAHPGAITDTPVQVSVGDDGHFSRQGTLDFIDNAMDRGSGTIHARATVPNPDLTLTPGQFARVRVLTGAPEQVLLVPAASLVPDQSRETVMVAAADGTVAQRSVTTGGLHGGLRIVRAGLTPADRVIIDGIALARPGAKVVALPGHIAPDAPADSQ